MVCDSLFYSLPRHTNLLQVVRHGARGIVERRRARRHAAGVHTWSVHAWKPFVRPPHAAGSSRRLDLWKRRLGRAPTTRFGVARARGAGDVCRPCTRAVCTRGSVGQPAGDSFYRRPGPGSRDGQGHSPCSRTRSWSLASCEGARHPVDPPRLCVASDGPPCTTGSPPTAPRGYSGAYQPRTSAVCDDGSGRHVTTHVTLRLASSHPTLSGTPGH